VRVAKTVPAAGTLSGLGPRYPERTDAYGVKFSKGHRTAWMVSGKRPVTRVQKRPLRPGLGGG